MEKVDPGQDQEKSFKLPIDANDSKKMKFSLTRKDLANGNTLSIAIETLNMTDHPLYEHTELGWEGTLDELVLFMLVESCQYHSEEEHIPIFDERVTKIGLSFRAHPTFKSILHILYLSS